MAIMGMVGAVIVMVVGLGMMSDAGGLGPPAGFKFMWVVMGLGIAAVNAYWAFADRPHGFYDVDVDPETEVGAGRQPASIRLRELERLHREGLISDAEHERKRAEILREL
jgi:hypothetical protein